ncbi:hypothetical protein [Pseudomonas sp. LF090]
MKVLIPSVSHAPFRRLHTPAELALLQLYRQLAEADQRIVHRIVDALVQCARG